MNIHVGTLTQGRDDHAVNEKSHEKKFMFLLHYYTGILDRAGKTFHKFSLGII